MVQRTVATLLLLIGSITIVVHSTTPSDKYYRFTYNDGKSHSLSTIEEDEEEGDNGDSSSHFSQIVVTNYNTTLIMKQDGSSTTIPLIITAPNKSSSNDNNLNTNNGWPAMQLSNGAMFQGQAGIIIGSLGVQEDDEEEYDPQKKNENDVNGGNAIEMYNGQSSSATGSVAYFFKGMNIIGGSGGGSDGQGGTALYVHGFGTEAYIYGGIFQGGQQQQGSNSTTPVNNNINGSSSSSSSSNTGLSIQVMNGGTVHLYSGIFIGDIEIGDSATIILYGCFVYNSSTSIVSGHFARNNNTNADEDDATPFLEIKITVLNENNGKVVIIPKSEQECDSAPLSSQSSSSSSSSSRGGKIRILQLLFRFVVTTLIFLYYFF